MYKQNSYLYQGEEFQNHLHMYKRNSYLYQGDISIREKNSKNIENISQVKKSKTNHKSKVEGAAQNPEAITTPIEQHVEQQDRCPDQPNRNNPQSTQSPR